MATLSKANMVTGNTITAADVTQLVDAFTAGGGYSVSISGSVTGSATSASFATTASYSETATSSSFATTSSIAYSVQYTSLSPSWGSFPPSSPLPITSATADLIVVNTAGSIGLSFGAGYEGQKLKLITDPATSEINATNVSISASGQVLGLNTITVSAGSPSTLDQLSLVTQMQSCEFYYIGGKWQFVGNLATP
jgi:hypothetical protein